MSLDAFRASVEHASIEAVSCDATPREQGDCGPSHPLVADAPSPEDDAVASQSARRVERTVQALPPRLREVLDMYFAENRTMRDIGALLGVTEARISQLVTQAIGRVREQVVEPLDDSRPSRIRVKAPAGRRQLATGNADAPSR